MQNPIFSRKIGLIIFIVWWATIAILHVAILSISYDLEFEFALADGIVFNLIYAILSIGIWFWVRYTDFEKQKTLNIIFNHLASATISILLWIAISDFILQGIFTDNTTYNEFLNSSIPWRIGEGTILYLLTSLIYYLTIYIQNFREQTLRESEVKSLFRDAELNWLKHQINPHFLFNSLNSISSLTMSNPEKAQEMVIRLSDLLRYSLKQSTESLVTVNDEISNCIKYLEIEKVRFGKRLNYSISAPENVMSFQLPAMILQPLFENAIKHGIAQSPDAGEIKASFELHPNYLKILITNTTSETNSSQKGMGVGLANIAKRLSLLYALNDLIQTKGSNNLFTVEVTVPNMNK